MIAGTMANRTETRRETTTLKFGSLTGALCLVVIFLCPALVSAQTTSFTYQGRFSDGGTAANGTYDMQFKLFDTATVGAGNQIGSTITNGAVLVSNGVFTVQLDYGAAAFSGADRYLEMGVRLAGDANPYTVLSPRQQLTSAVYAIRAKSAAAADTATTATSATTATNATQLGGVAANQYVLTNDSRLSDSRSPTPGSASYIQNTAAVQAASNFNVSGNGTAGGTLSAKVVDTTTNYSIGGNPVLSISGSAGAQNVNTFTGIGAGSSNTPTASGGIFNSFFGSSSGTANNAGRDNSFFGAFSGRANIGGSNNSFFGVQAGDQNIAGSDNSFFGHSAGRANKSSGRNSFFGSQAGIKSIGALNSFFGASAGASNFAGFSNAFFGTDAGYLNTSGSYNAFLGSQAGYNNTEGSENVFVGHDVGDSNLTGSDLTLIGSKADVTGGLAGLLNATAIGAFAKVTKSNSLVLGSIAGVNNATDDTNVGIGTTAPSARLHVNGLVRIDVLGAGGIDHLCYNGSKQISACSSSLRYKTNIQPFISGLSVLNRLRPITFDWKQGGMHDLGFGAEDIAAVEPLLVTHNDKGEVEGVKYDRITAVLVNAVKEQQTQISAQQSQLSQQQREIDGLKRLLRRHVRR